MTATQALAAYGTTVSWDGTDVAEVLTMTPPEATVDQIDVTSFTSPDQYKEFIGGFKDGGEFSFEMNFVAADPGQVKLLADFASSTRRTVIIANTTIGFTLTFTGLITKCPPVFDLNSQMKLKATIKVAGASTVGVTATDDLTTLTGIEENTGAALTFTPTFDGAVYTYNLAVNTASTWVKVTPTLATATIAIHSSATGAVDQSVASAAQSGTIALTDGGVTTITLSVKTTGKAPKIYTLHVYTP
jgi:hypothetical protein